MNDLDMLPSQCTSLAGRELLQEAITCFHARAYRASVVTLWLAVVFDSIAKLQALELSGSKQARQKLDAYEKAQADHKYDDALEFERSLVDYLHDQLQMISKTERTDLHRLREDRNSCAHPASRNSTERYVPTPDLVRHHIRAAFQALLSKEPIYGKHALDLVHELLDSQYFPKTEALIRQALQNSPLGHAGQALLKAFFVVCIKDIVHPSTDAPDWASKEKYALCLKVLFEMHPLTMVQIAREEFAPRYGTPSDDHYPYAAMLFSHLPDLFDRLDGPRQQMFYNFVSVLDPNKDFKAAESIWSTSIFAGHHSNLYAKMDLPHQMQYVSGFEDLPQPRQRQFIDWMQKRVCEIGAFNVVNPFFNQIINRCLKHYTFSDAVTLSQNFTKLQPLYDSTGAPATLKKLLEQFKDQPQAELQAGFSDLKAFLNDKVVGVRSPDPDLLSLHQKLLEVLGEAVPEVEV